jgi:hypothetical protein
VVLGFAPASNPHKGEVYPRLSLPHEAIPERAREYLRQAQETYFQPAASIAMSASAIDSMLKAKGYKKGTLNERIDQAAADHIITDDMAKWGHQVRLDRLPTSSVVNNIRRALASQPGSRAAWP